MFDEQQTRDDGIRFLHFQCFCCCLRLAGLLIVRFIGLSSELRRLALSARVVSPFWSLSKAKPFQNFMWQKL